MAPTDNTNMPSEKLPSDNEGTPRKIKVDQILADIKAGLRTRGFLEKYNLTMGEFEGLLKKMIRKGILTVEEYTTWKSHRRTDAPTAEPLLADTDMPSAAGPGHKQGITTFVIKDPEKND